MERYVETVEDDLLPDDQDSIFAGEDGKSWNDVAKRHGFKNAAELQKVADKVEAQAAKLPTKVQERLKQAKQRKKDATSSPPK